MFKENKMHVAFRCPERLYNKLMDINDNGEKTLTEILIRGLRSSFAFLKLFDAMNEIMTEKQKEKILFPALRKLNEFEEEDIIAFAGFYKKEKTNG